MDFPIPEGREADFAALVTIILAHVDTSLISVGQREIVSAMLSFSENYKDSVREEITEECNIDV